MNSIATKMRVTKFAYPTLSETVVDILHHWFFVGGNGHRWVNGELVDECSRGLPGYEEAVAKVANGEIPKWSPKSDDTWDQIGHYGFYPLGRGSRCMDIPLDAKPEWRKACIGFLKYVQTRIPDNQREREQVIENIDFALQRIEEQRRFNGAPV